jgi:hypothetical protein
MKKAFLIALAISAVAGIAHAGTGKGSVLDHDPDLWGPVTPDRLLGKTTRQKWLKLYPVEAKIYWAAWDCKEKGCDTPQRKHIRDIAKLVPRSASDPAPLADTSAGH